MADSYISSLKNKFKQCVRNTCGKSKCKIHLVGFPAQKIILDMDCSVKVIGPKQQPKRCDYVIVTYKEGVTVFFPIEFKASSLSVTEVKKQLKGGIGIFERHLPQGFGLRPVLVCKKLHNRMEIREIKKTRIEYKGKKSGIEYLICNQNLNWVTE